MSSFLLFLNGTSIFVGQQFKIDCAVKPWKQLQEEYGLANNLNFKWIQLTYSLSKLWTKEIFVDSGNSINQSCYPRPSLNQKKSNTRPRQIRQQRIM